MAHEIILTAPVCTGPIFNLFFSIKGDQKYPVLQVRSNLDLTQGINSSGLHWI